MWETTFFTLICSVTLEFSNVKNSLISINNIILILPNSFAIKFPSVYPVKKKIEIEMMILIGKMNVTLFNPFFLTAASFLFRPFGFLCNVPYFDEASETERLVSGEIGMVHSSGNPYQCLRGTSRKKGRVISFFLNLEKVFLEMTKSATEAWKLILTRLRDVGRNLGQFQGLWSSSSCDGKLCVSVQRLTISVGLGLLFTVSADWLAKFSDLFYFPLVKFTWQTWQWFYSGYSSWECEFPRIL